MRRPVSSLIWEIWLKNRAAARLAVGMLLLGWIFNCFIPSNLQAAAAWRERIMTVNCLMMAGSLMLVLGIFNYTEFNPQREWTGFPYRLFALPVPTWQLVAVPMILGVAAIELVLLAWLALVFGHRLEYSHWLAVLLGTFMTIYQTLLWMLAGFRILRIVILGLVGAGFVGIAFLPAFGKLLSLPWLSEKTLIPLLAATAAATFLSAWAGIALQRCGGGRRRNWLKVLIERISDALPGRTKDFRSPAAAQFWFEWRRIGWLLPLSIGAMLVLVIGPVSWHLRDERGTTLWILAWTLAMPVIVAAAAGKGFSKPDFWSRDLSLSPFVAVRPLATGEMVVIKMKVAARSAAVSWLLVLAFLSVWFPLWANLESLSMMRIGYWMAFSHSVLPQYLMAALVLLAGMLLTWKFLVGGLCVGLSGNKKLFIAAVLPYCLALLLGLMALIILLRHETAVRAWVRHDPSRLLSYCEWIAALGVAAKFWIAARAWHRVSPCRVRQYLLLWCGATLVFVALAILLWARGLLSLQLMAADVLPLDVYRLRNLLVLLALLAVPFARIGLVPAALQRNRHG